MWYPKSNETTSQFLVAIILFNASSSSVGFKNYRILKEYLNLPMYICNFTFVFSLKSLIQNRFTPIISKFFLFYRISMYLINPFAKILLSSATERFSLSAIYFGLNICPSKALLFWSYRTCILQIFSILIYDHFFSFQ